MIFNRIIPSLLLSKKRLVKGINFKNHRDAGSPPSTIRSLNHQGADEIISDYYNVTSNSRRSCLKGNWKLATKPWKNFYDGWNAAHLAAIERVAGAYGIETRYPFLDFDLIQSFLALPTHLKAKVYKAPMVEILKNLKFPYHDVKIGFTQNVTFK